MAKLHNAVDKRCNKAVMLLNEAEKLKVTKDVNIAEIIQKECAKQTNEVNNMINALKEALSNLSIAWNIADAYAKVNIDLKDLILEKAEKEKKDDKCK